ncbi:MAG: hypothetical protein NVSMB59_10590 [Vulcanimicrobiaceae bacterium]
MSGTLIARDVCQRLALFIEARRYDIVASVSKSAAVSRPGAPAASTFVNAVLDRLCQELEVCDHDALDVWIDAQSASVEREELARLVHVAFATIAAKYTSECGDLGGVIAYFASRSSELEKRFGVERVAPPRDGFAPAKLLTRNDAVAALLAAIEARDPATCDHSRAVGMWSARIAKTLGMTHVEQATAMLAGTLHDVGKVTTPTEILRKSSSLEGDEWELMRAHARVGAKLLERIPALADIAPIVRSHHERIDGCGYPDRLRAEHIAPLARVIAVADSFHAMISKRPYRKPMPVLLALDELRAGAGTQWDGDVVRAMFAIVQPASTVRRLRAVRDGTNA